MNPKIVAIAAIVIAVGLMRFAMVKAHDKMPGGTSKETGRRGVIADGNQLYAWCAVAEKTVTLSGGKGVIFSGSREDVQSAVYCWAYINGEVDSTTIWG